VRCRRFSGITGGGIVAALPFIAFSNGIGAGVNSPDFGTPLELVIESQMICRIPPRASDFALLAHSFRRRHSAGTEAIEA
jgi:hypothetical protein